jgi:hypothetical protein
MKFLKSIILFFLIIPFTSCKFTRPLTSEVRNSKVVVKDYSPGKVRITKEYNYITIRQIAVLGLYTNTRIIDIDNGQTIELTRTRRIAGFSNDKPSYIAVKKIYYDSKAKRQLVTKKIFKWGTDVILDKTKYFEKGKRIRKENCLKE